MSKAFRCWEDIPSDVRNNILNVVTENHIDFDPANITGGLQDVFVFTREENTNNRLGYNGDIYGNTYRLQDHNGRCVYVQHNKYANGRNKNISFDFYDESLKRSDYIYIEIRNQQLG